MGLATRTRVLLINPPFPNVERYGSSLKHADWDDHVLPPQGLCHLAASLPVQEFFVHILDAQALGYDLRQVLDAVLDFSPSYVGITTFTASVDLVATICQEIQQQLPSCQTIVGGPHISACPKETFTRYNEFQIGVIGEGEVTFAELIEFLEHHGDLRKVRGIIFRDHQGHILLTEARPLIKELDILPMPRWDLLPDMSTYYRSPKTSYRILPSTSIVTSRGCPYKCAFCDRAVHGRHWRSHSVSTILEWIRYLIKHYGIRDLSFHDDHFTVNKKRLRQLCSALKAEFPNLIWSTFARADSIDKESLRIMKDAGCWQIAYGIESASQKILDNLQKGETIDQIRYAIRLTKESGIEVMGLFMAGSPGETADTLDQTKEFIQELAIEHWSISAFTPLPGTTIHDNWETWGVWEDATPDDWAKMNLWRPIFIPYGVTSTMLEQFLEISSASK